jgi:hypothetical protein
LQRTSPAEFADNVAPRPAFFGDCEMARTVFCVGTSFNEGALKPHDDHAKQQMEHLK